MAGKWEPPEYVIACAYDTETTNYRYGEEPADVLAYPVLYIASDLRGIDLRTYEVGCEPINLYRDGADMLAWLDELITWGAAQRKVPVVVAYNLLFDLQPLMYDLAQRYRMQVSAQSSTHAYTVDVLDEDGNVSLRFWDMFYLEMRGVAAMGDTCGVAKATGKWDYRLVRTPATPLTNDEERYASRDVQVLPAYLRYLLESNPWLEPGMLGYQVITKTSLVRQAGKRETGAIRVRKRDGSRVTVYAMMERLCASEIAPTYDAYALRKACFYGGFTFTAAAYAGQVVENVYSLDVTSMHHAFINGALVPVRFHPAKPRHLQRLFDIVCATSAADVLAHYEEPFGRAFHARVRYTNIRLRSGTVFERCGIAPISEGKFRSDVGRGEWGGEADDAAEETIRDAGWKADGINCRFAFSKLMSADSVTLHVNEVEAWLIHLCYDYDEAEVLLGECTASFIKPPDYVTLLSNLLFERKQAMKYITKTYHEGEPYAEPIPEVIPEGIAARLRDGSMSATDVNGYYNSTVKGQFNSIYGMEAQDVMKPSYVVGTDGAIAVDPDTVVTAETYADRLKKVRDKPVLYTYGMRIVGRSRLHLAIAMQLLDSAYGDSIVITGGDTDSLKVSCTPGITADDLLDALRPLHGAVTDAIDRAQERVRRVYPDYASKLTGVGCFEVEGDAYPLHMDAWNKARVSWDGERAHVTCAGLSRPQGSYTIETWLHDMVRAGWDFRGLAPLTLGWNVRVAHAVCHALEHKRPEPRDTVDLDITDYRGVTAHVTARQSIALYDADRVLGDTCKGVNARSVAYLRSIGRTVPDGESIIDVDMMRDGPRPRLRALTLDGWEDMRPYDKLE